MDSISKEQIRRLFVNRLDIYQSQEMAAKPRPTVVPPTNGRKEYRRRRNRQRRLEKWVSEDDTLALLYWDQFWRNLLHLPMAGNYSPKGDFQRIAPNGRVSMSVYLALDMKTRETYHLYIPYCRSRSAV